MNSLRSDLTRRLWLASGSLLLLAALVIFLVTRHLLVAQFDHTLRTKSEALMAAADVDGKKIEFDLSLKDFAGFADPATGDAFVLRRGDGTFLMASPSLDGEELPRFTPPAMGGSKILHDHLADGRPARFFVSRFLVRGDKKARFPDVYLVVSADASALYRNLWALALVLLATSLGVMALTGPVVRHVLRRGLAPLDRLGRELRGIAPDSLDGRVNERNLPAELQIVPARLNELLGRLEASFERERQFSSHAAHELRTPLAELRTLAEMGANWPDKASPDQCREMLQVILELEDLLRNLSLLSQADSGRVEIHGQELETGPFLEDILRRFRPRAGDRVLCERVHARVIHGDPFLLGVIMGNLVENALAYSPPGSRVEVELGPGSLRVANPSPDLSTPDLAHLFERFWRRDSSRSGYGHCGLGLSIVRSFATLLGGDCRAHLDDSGRFEIAVTWPPGLHHSPSDLS